MSLEPHSQPVLVISGEFARVHYALVFSSTLLALGHHVTLMFAVDAVTTLTASFGRPGWHRLRGGEGRSAEATDAEWRERGIAGFEALLAACAALGARFIACEMALAAARLDRGDLRTDLPIEVAGVVTLISDVGRTPIVF